MADHPPLRGSNQTKMPVCPIYFEGGALCLGCRRVDNIDFVQKRTNFTTAQHYTQAPVASIQEKLPPVHKPAAGLVCMQ